MIGGCGWTGTWGQVNQYIIQHRKFTPFETDSCPFLTLASWEGGVSKIIILANRGGGGSEMNSLFGVGQNLMVSR